MTLQSEWTVGCAVYTRLVKVARDATKLLRRGSGVVGYACGITVLKGMTMYERFTDRSRKVMQLANQESQRFNHEYVGALHILLGLLKEGSGVGANVLKNLDVDLRRLRLEVEKVLPAGPDMVTMGKLPQTPTAKLVVEGAIEAARELNNNYVGTEHLLLGLCKASLGARIGAATEANSLRAVFVGFGITAEIVKAEVMMLLGANKAAGRHCRFSRMA